MGAGKITYTREFYLERAEEMRALADQMSNADAKQKMIGVAESYERLAERAPEKIDSMSQVTLPETKPE